MTRERDFVLLGAGFSRAISDAMPLLNDLSDEVLPRVGKTSESTLAAYGGNFEAWMSHLAVDQPWLTDAENFRNRALFVEASGAVQDVIVEREASAVSTPPPAWLIRLLMHWSHHQAVLCTFNYDLLIERCLTSLRLLNSWADLYSAALEERHPPGVGIMISSSSSGEAIPELLKLHGSVSWSYGGPGAPVSDRITLTRSELAWQTPFIGPERQGKYRALHDGLVPLIVPPTSTKNAFYANLSLRAQWRRAYDALKDARSLTIIGYSFPPSDLQTRHFVAEATASDIPVTVVNPSESSRANVSELLRRTDVHGFHGDGAIETYVEATCGSVLRFGVQPGEAPRPIITVDGVDEVPPDWSVADVEPGNEYQAAREWLYAAVNERWPGRPPEHDDAWAETSHGFRLDMTYLPRDFNGTIHSP
jgi:hypothetical protein